MRALERRDKILELLCEKRFLKTADLVREFNTTRTTIQNDILELSLSYPVFTKKGTGGDNMPYEKMKIYFDGSH